MDDQELLTLLQDLESDRVERKVSGAARDRICEAICAFANDLPNHRRPGVLFIGVGDDGSCAHLTITDELLLTLAGMRSDGNIMPFPAMTIQKKILHGQQSFSQVQVYTFWTDGQWNVNRNRRLPSHGMRGSTPALSSFASRLVRMAAAAAACSKP